MNNSPSRLGEQPAAAFYHETRWGEGRNDALSSRYGWMGAAGVAFITKLRFALQRMPFFLPSASIQNAQKTRCDQWRLPCPNVTSLEAA